MPPRVSVRRRSRCTHGAGFVADEGAGSGDGEMGLSGAGAADQDHIALVTRGQQGLSRAGHAGHINYAPRLRY